MPDAERTASATLERVLGSGRESGALSVDDGVTICATLVERMDNQVTALTAHRAALETALLRESSVVAGLQRALRCSELLNRVYAAKLQIAERKRKSCNTGCTSTCTAALAAARAASLRLHGRLAETHVDNIDLRRKMRALARSPNIAYIKKRADHLVENE